MGIPKVGQYHRYMYQTITYTYIDKYQRYNLFPVSRLFICEKIQDSSNE